MLNSLAIGFGGYPPSKCHRPAAALSGTLPHPSPSPRGCALIAHAQAGFASESFDIPAAPVLIPEGDWTVVEGSVTAAKGFTATGMHAQLRAAGQKGDLALVVCDVDAVAAGAFTQNVMCAAPVTYCKNVLAKRHTVRAVMTNAGSANAATGDRGYLDACETAQVLADCLGVSPDEVLLQSTGVIGKRMQVDNFKAAIPALVDSLETGPEGAHRAAVSITTTDLVSKSCAIQMDIGGATVTLGGIAKGSGMIHPNMATMLGVMTTDAAVAASAWATILKRATRNSFNQITVDGDTSTNDTVLGLASGLAGNALITDPASEEGRLLEAGLTACLRGCAKAIAWDGEGATCLVEVTVRGGASQEAANQVARSVAGSSLTKAAIFGHDPNWGRIACAAGYSGINFNQNELSVQLGPHKLMDRGQPLDYDAGVASAYLKDTTATHGTVAITVGIGSGPGVGLAWGCDLSYDYVKINAEYTT